jgi:hypothetical protein
MAPIFVQFGGLEQIMREDAARAWEVRAVLQPRNSGRDIVDR